jgi:ATP-dependent Clp endopeptidase proteolytic subunit ClpP
MRPCFTFKMAAKDDEPDTLAIMEEIGFWGVQAADFRSQLKALKSKDLTLEINSPGGDVFAGIAIYNMLKGSGKSITVKVLGIAASAASLVAMAGDKVLMPENSFLMVHNPWGVAIGTAEEMRETADVLDKIGTSVLASYIAKSGMAEDDLKALMKTDTYLTAAEALDYGLADEVIGAVEAKASFDLARADLPENVKAVYLSALQREQQQVPETALAAQVQQLATSAGLGEYAAYLAISCDTLEVAQSRISEASEIVTLCALAQMPDDASGLIRAGKTVAQARTSLLAAMAAKDVHINSAAPTPAPVAKKGINPTAYWAEQNAKQAKKD